MRHAIELTPVPPVPAGSPVDTGQRSCAGRSDGPDTSMRTRSRRRARTRRTLAVATVSLLLMVDPGPATAAPCWVPPVEGRIVDPFRPPNCPFCAGNRGIEYRVDGTVAVRAVQAGTVTFSGTVAGTRYVVVDHADGWKLTYGTMSDVAVTQGQRVVRGARLGSAAGDFYFGLRVGEDYRDPQPFLGTVLGRARLVPIDGTPRRPVPAPRHVC